MIEFSYSFTLSVSYSSSARGIKHCPVYRSVVSTSCSLMSRRVEELLWVLNRAELKEELYYAIVNFDIFIYMFARYSYHMHNLNQPNSRTDVICPFV